MPELYNHTVSGLSDLERRMVEHIPPGGNWEDIPESVPSQRLAQIREMSRTRGKCRTTYYGRLSWEQPSYTISTYFSRIGNGCHIHPSQPRLISIREGARLQSFPDSFRFTGSRTSQYVQIGNAVPPLMAYHLARMFQGKRVMALFAGAGGTCLGFQMAGKSPLVASDWDRNASLTHRANFPNATFVEGDLSDESVKLQLASAALKQNVDLVIGGPPCQGFSTAGWFKPEDARNRLPYDFVDVLRRVKPREFLIENVPGLAYMEKGAILASLLEQLRDSGYKVNHSIVDASTFGVPQRRKRLFIWGSTDRLLVLPVPHTSGRPETVQNAIGDLPPLVEGAKADPVEYTQKPATPYQQWARGELSVAALVEAQKRATPISNPKLFDFATA